MTTPETAVAGGLAVALMVLLGFLWHWGLGRVMIWLGTELRVHGDSMRSAGSDWNVRATSRETARKELRASHAAKK